MTWPGPDADLLSAATFRLVADAGFSINMSFLGGREKNLKALELAQPAGLKLMIQDDRVSKLLEDGAVALDSDHPVYINLFPTYANETQLGTPTYEEHVARYLDTVRPPFLSFDHYPVMKTGLRPDYYMNLEIVRRMALERGLDLWAFTLVTPHAVYPPPTAGHIRLQLFSDIAYGAKGLQYFTFGTPGGTDYDWGSGLVRKDGRPGPAYPLAREVNAEVRRIERLVLRWKSVAVYHSEPVPEGAKPLAAEGPIIGITGAPLVIGVFSDGPTTYVMFVNRDYEKSRTAVIRFASDVGEALEIPKSDRPPARLAWPDERICVLEFDAGDARIFRLK